MLLFKDSSWKEYLGKQLAWRHADMYLLDQTVCTWTKTT